MLTFTVAAGTDYSAIAGWVMVETYRGREVTVQAHPDALPAVIAAGWTVEIDGEEYAPRLRAHLHDRYQDQPPFSVDWRNWPGVMVGKPVPVLTWGSGATQGDIVARDWYLQSQLVISPDGDPVVIDGEQPFARDEVTYWTPEGAAGPSGRDTVVTLYAEDGSTYATRTVAKAYDLEASKAAGKRRRARVWSEIENLLLGLLLMGGMDGTAAGSEAQRLKESITLTAIDAFLSTTAQADPLRAGLAAAQTSTMFPWLDTVVSPAGDVVQTINAMLARWTA